MPNYKIVLANKDIDGFVTACNELNPSMPIVSTPFLSVATKYEITVTEEDYVFLSLKFKFLKPIIKILKPRPVNGSNIKFTP